MKGQSDFFSSGRSEVAIVRWTRRSPALAEEGASCGQGPGSLAVVASGSPDGHSGLRRSQSLRRRPKLRPLGAFPQPSDSVIAGWS